MVPAIAVGGLGGLVIAIQPPDSMASIGGQGMPSGWPWLLALLYAIGLVVWLDRSAFVLRLSGWVLMAAALVVPLTLTPVLPVVAAMVVTIASIPSGRGPQRVPLGAPPDGGEGSITGISSHVRF